MNKRIYIISMVLGRSKIKSSKANSMLVGSFNVYCGSSHVSSNPNKISDFSRNSEYKIQQYVIYLYKKKEIIAAKNLGSVNVI